MIESVDFLPQRDVECLVNDINLALISITDEGEARLPVCGHYIRLRFLDSSPEVDFSLVPREEFYEYWEGVMTPDDARMVLDFLQAIHCSSKKYRLIVHCHHGRYRSAAIAKFVHEEYGCPILKPIKTRNEHVYRLMLDPRYVDGESGEKTPENVTNKPRPTK